MESGLLKEILRLAEADPWLAVVVLAAIAAIVLAGRDVFRKLFTDKRSDPVARVDQMIREANSILPMVASGGHRQLSIFLQPEERGLLEEPSTFYEARATRVYGVGATRIGKFTVGGGASRSHQTLRQVDQGRLALTDQRLIFDGSLENRVLKLSDIVSVEILSDAIEVSSSRRQKSQVFSVANPVLWFVIIRGLAQGKVPTQVHYEGTDLHIT